MHLVVEKPLSIKLVLSAITDTPDDPGDPQASQRVSMLLQEYPEGVEYSISDSEHGIGAGWQTITLEVLSIASGVFFGVPALRKKVKEALEGCPSGLPLKWAVRRQTDTRSQYLSPSDRVLLVVGASTPCSMPRTRGD